MDIGPILRLSRVTPEFPDSVNDQQLKPRSQKFSRIRRGEDSMKTIKNPLETIVVIAAVAFVTAMKVDAATITVTSTNDTGPGTLRAALASAGNGATIVFSLTPPA